MITAIVCGVTAAALLLASAHDDHRNHHTANRTHGGTK